MFALLVVIKKTKKQKTYICLKIFFDKEKKKKKREKIFHPQALGLGPLKAVLKSAGGWPLLEGPAWREQDFTWLNHTINSYLWNCLEGAKHSVNALIMISLQVWDGVQT